MPIWYSPITSSQNRHAILQLQHRRPSLDDIPPPYAANVLKHVERPFYPSISSTVILPAGLVVNTPIAIAKLDLFEADIAKYRHAPPIPGQLPLDCDRLIAIMREDIPLQGKFECK